MLHHQFHLDRLQSATDLNDLDVWVKVDTGMGRLGFSTARAQSIISFLASLNTLGNIRLMTHLASADDVDSHYIPTVRSALSIHWGCGNTNGESPILPAFSVGPTHINCGRERGLRFMVPIRYRIANPAARDLQPVMTMKSIVLAVNRHRQGDLIGYANTFTCSKDMEIAVIASGYADG